MRTWPPGRPAPALGLFDLDGRAWRLENLKGQAVLLNFWATWCAPCRAEMPSLAALAARHGRDGLIVLLVNYKEEPAPIRRFFERTPLALPVLLDPDGDAAAEWTPRVFPTTVLVDRLGQPRQSVIGELDWLGSAARDIVEPLLERPRST
jgi:thiol-disulfide isomerase/thioredoxin